MRAKVRVTYDSKLEIVEFLESRSFQILGLVRPEIVVRVR